MHPLCRILVKLISFRELNMNIEKLFNLLTNNEERQKLEGETLRELEAEFIKSILMSEEPMIM